MARMRIAHLVTRELGMALAVLALWMMSLLAPLHQTSGLLRHLADAGHALPASWSICVTLAQSDVTEGHPDVICPAHGIAKIDLATPPVPVRVAAVIGLPSQMQVDPAIAPARPQIARSAGQPRAPPAVI